MDKGMTLIEVVIAVVVFAIFAIGVYQGYLAIYSSIAYSRHKALAADLANSELEIIKNMSYSEVGTVGGDPEGVIPSVSDVVRDGIPFEVTITIEPVDDPFDGTAGNGDLFPEDYKLVEVNVACTTCNNFIPVVITGRVAPKNLES